jgi:glycosyltransferase involved in cell wall biosynthesis
LIVKIIEWYKRFGSISRWAAECFDAAGCKVAISTDWNDTSGADLVYSPVPGLKKGDSPLFTQLEGYGAVSVLPGSKPSPRLRATFDNSDKVGVIDPNMHLELLRCGLDQNTLMIPNPIPNIVVPPKESQKFTVFYPSGTWSIKKPERIIEAARLVGKEEPNIRFAMSVGSKIWHTPLDWLNLDNVDFLPNLSHEKMLEQYAKANIVIPFSACEIQPWTVFESFIAGKPTIVDVIGMIQSVHREHVEEMISWFGTPSRVFHDTWARKYGSGEKDHYLWAGSSEDLAWLILELYHDEKRRLELGKNALEWAEAYKWKPKDKGEKILELMGLKKPLIEELGGF